MIGNARSHTGGCLPFGFAVPELRPRFLHWSRGLGVKRNRRSVREQCRYREAAWSGRLGLEVWVLCAVAMLCCSLQRLGAGQSACGMGGCAAGVAARPRAVLSNQTAAGIYSAGHRDPRPGRHRSRCSLELLNERQLGLLGIPGRRHPAQAPSLPATAGLLALGLVIWRNSGSTATRFENILLFADYSHAGAWLAWRADRPASAVQ